MRLEDIAFVDVATGEAVSLLEVMTLIDRSKRKTKHFKLDWMVVFQKAMEEVATMGLTKNSLIVFLFLVAKADKNNLIHLTQANVAKATKMSSGTVSMAFKELRERGIVLTEVDDKMDKTTYRINVHYAWRGDKAEYERRYSTDPQPVQ